MKNLIRFAILIVFLALTSCGGDAKSMLCKKWLLDGQALKSAVEAEIARLEKEKPEEAGMAKMALSLMGSMFKDGGMIMEFKKDGTCETTMLSKKNEGKWELSADKKTIIITTSKDKQNMIIKEITANRLVLVPETLQKNQLAIKGMESLIFKAEK